MTILVENQNKLINLRLINNAISLETIQRVLIVITNRPFDLRVDLETSAIHDTLYWTKHVNMTSTINRGLVCRANGRIYQ